MAETVMVWGQRMYVIGAMPRRPVAVALFDMDDLRHELTTYGPGDGWTEAVRSVLAMMGEPDDD